MRPECDELDSYHRRGMVTFFFLFSEQYSRLLQIQETAKAAGIGKWSKTDPQEHVRAITWTLIDPRKFYEANRNKPVKGETPLFCLQISLCILFIGRNNRKIILIPRE